MIRHVKQLDSSRIVNEWSDLPATTICVKTMDPFKNGVDKALEKYNKYTHGVGQLWQSVVHRTSLGHRPTFHAVI